MNRIGAVLLALALGLGACTSDGEPDDETSPTAAESPATDDSESEPEDDPSPTPSPSPDDADDSDHTDAGETDAGDTDAGETDGDATDGETDGDTTDDPDEPDTAGDTPGGPAADTPSTPVSYDASASTFAADTSHSRGADFSGACHVVAAAGETIHECVKLFSDVNNAWMGVVEATTADATTVTVYRHDGTGFTSALRAPADSPDTYSLAVTAWEHAEDLARATSSAGTDLLAWDRTGQPRVVARIPADGTTTYTAQRVVRRSAAGVEVLAVPDSGDGIAGSRTAAGSEEDVALTVYDAWVRAERAAAASHATDEVLQELFERTPAGNDSFELNGTDCGQAGTQVACGFTARVDGRTFQLTWTLGTIDGALQVVELASSG
ncbi:MAG TPA: hypothetical protein VGA36_05975 [Nitriliruptorales bacterium]